jgi:hypothetical protein
MISDPSVMRELGQMCPLWSLITMTWPTLCFLVPGPHMLKPPQLSLLSLACVPIIAPPVAPPAPTYPAIPTSQGALTHRLRLSATHAALSRLPAAPSLPGSLLQVPGCSTPSLQPVPSPISVAKQISLEPSTAPVVPRSRAKAWPGHADLAGFLTH